METRRIILLVLAIVLGMALVGALLAAAGAPSDAFRFLFVPFGLLFNPFTLLVLLIVFLVMRRGRQQQQQQIVIHTTTVNPDPSPVQAAPRRRCPACKRLSARTARFCGHCGVGFPQ